ncbi:hypothetical protein [Xanthomonas tesorieronis]|uniref:hypothetical protein n=1 Tax=Xanthomonas tesorieronis TaxID=3160839 RepID=UPI003518B303
MHIVKDKIPKSASFVLRPSLLERMIQEVGLSARIDLHQIHSAILFDAFFWPPRPNVPHEFFLVRAGTVPANQAKIARAHIETSVLPDFIAWAAAILQLPPNSPVRRSNQKFARVLPGHMPNHSSKPTPLRGVA